LRDSGSKRVWRLLKVPIFIGEYLYRKRAQRTSTKTIAPFTDNTPKGLSELYFLTKVMIIIWLAHKKLRLKCYQRSTSDWRIPFKFNLKTPKQRYNYRKYIYVLTGYI
jgi:hypothetical protein